jgi:hypothetical protein
MKAAFAILPLASSALLAAAGGAWSFSPGSF